MRAKNFARKYTISITRTWNVMRTTKRWIRGYRGFRMRQGSHDALKRHLSTSHEFHAVLTERIAEACPGLTRRDKYRALDEILESRSKQLANADDASTVSDIVTGHLQP